MTSKIYVGGPWSTARPVLYDDSENYGTLTLRPFKEVIAMPCKGKKNSSKKGGGKKK